MSKKFVILQNYTPNRGEEDYKGRPTQINVGLWSDQKQKKFLTILKNLKKQEFGGVDCYFWVLGDNFSYNVKPWKKEPTEIICGINKDYEAQPDELVVDVRPKCKWCAKTHPSNCPIRIASGTCNSPFIRKYIGEVLFPDKYKKQR